MAEPPKTDSQRIDSRPQKKSGSVVLVASCASLLIVLAFCCIGILDIKKWIEGFVSSQIREEFSCKSIEWCGVLKICAKRCKTNNSAALSIGDIALDLTTGKVKAADLNISEFSKLPKVKLKRFPDIPLLIKNIEVSNLAIALPNAPTAIPPIKTLQLKRNTTGQRSWMLSASSQDESIDLTGKVGDVVDLKASLNGYRLSLPGLEGSLVGNVNLQSPRLFGKSLSLSTNNLTISGLKVLGNEPHAKISCKGLMSLLPSLDGLNNVKDVVLVSDGLTLHASTEGDKLELKLDRTDAANLKPWLTNLLIQAPLKQKLLSAISGEVWASGGFQLTDPMSGAYTIHFAKLQAAGIGSLNGSITLGSSGTQNAEIKFAGVNLAALKNLFAPPEDKTTLSGTMSGYLAYDSSTMWRGNAQVTELNVHSHDSDIELEEGTGQVSLNWPQLRANIASKLKTTGENIDLKGDFNIASSFEGTVEALMPQLTLPTLAIPTNANSSLHGRLTDLNGLISFSDGIPTIESIELTIDELALKDNLTGDRSGISGGKVNYSHSAGRIDLQSVEFVLPDEHSHAVLHASFKVTPQFRSVHPQSMTFNGSASAEAIADSLDIVFDDPSIKAWTSTMRKSKGHIKADASITAGKLNSASVEFAATPPQTQDLSISELSGKISYDGELLNLSNIQLAYGSSSQVRLNGSASLNNSTMIEDPLSTLNDLRGFRGELEGLISPSDLVGEERIDKYDLRFAPETSFPVNIKIAPSPTGAIGFDLHSEFKNLAKINKVWRLSPDGKSGIIEAKGNFDPLTNSMNVDEFSCSAQGLNVIGQLSGRTDDLSFKLETHPHIDLAEMFNSDTAVSTEGQIEGWMSGEGVNIFDGKTFWNNLKLSLHTVQNKPLKVGPVIGEDAELYFESKDGAGFSTLVIDRGKVKDLSFNGLNGSMTLQDYDLRLPGLIFQTAGGTVDLRGVLHIQSGLGVFSGSAKDLDVGEVAKDLFGEKGFGGKGDFVFLVDGHLGSLVKKQEPVSASGTFALQDGHAAPTSELSKKLNLANLVFGGPLALNVNNILEVFSPQTDGFYHSLDGEWIVDEDKVVITSARFRGKNRLNLNMSGVWLKESNNAKFNIMGSIPRIPVRLNSQGEESQLLNILTHINPLTAISYITNFFRKSRVFSFTMAGNLANPNSLNDSAGKTFEFVNNIPEDNLPTPELPPEAY